MEPEVPLECEVDDCSAAVETWCPLCDRFYCEQHDILPDGHPCLRGLAAIANLLCEAR